MVRSPPMWAGLRPTDWIVLPGVQSHRRRPRPGCARRADQSIAAHAGQGGTVLGACGGLQMLGEALIDPEGIDGNGPAWACCPGHRVRAAKTVQRTSAAFGQLTGARARCLA